MIQYFLFQETQLSGVIAEMCLFLFVFAIIERLSSQKVKTGLYFSFSTFISFLYMAVVVYHNYYGAILTFSAFDQAGQLSEIGDSITSLIQPDMLLFFIDLPLIALLLYFKNRLRIEPFKMKVKASLTIMAISACLLLAGLFSQLDVINEKKVAENIGIFNYNFFTMIPKSNALNTGETLTQEHIEDLKNTSYHDEKILEGVAVNKNIIVIQLEAFQNFPIEKMIGDAEITPNINQLLKESFYFSNVYQQIGKGNTSDAEFMLNTSLYPRGDVAMSQTYGNKEIPSLPKMLKEYGYTSVTMHTNDVEFWNRDEMYDALGFDEVFEKKEFENKDVIAFGPSDEVLYEKALTHFADLHEQGNKFYANLISMSSHHPFKIPDNKPQLALPQEYINTTVGDYLQAIHYADYAIGLLIDGLKGQGIWDETVFVLYGDHFGLQLGSERAEQLVKNLLGRNYHSKLDAFNIPFIISVPGYRNGIEIEKIGGQIDLMPTLANLIGISLENHIHFGQDLINSDSNVLGSRFYLPTGSFLNDNILFIPGKGFEDGSATSIETKQPVENFEKYTGDFERILQLMNLSDEYMDTLPNRKE
ncbi:LTA synthase family protein [Robertmurraya massiliosenegalensis]|uniref:LTA synthase family protein n=1 Tax=Robertmurraya massiliosenegalensis TaxID=1287657 RepID=UPI003D280553